MAGSSSEMRKGRLLSDSSLAGPFGPSTCAVAHYTHYRRLLDKCQPFPAKNPVSREKLDAFLQFTGFEVLDNPGKVSAEVAKRLAEEQFERFRVKQDEAFESDFEREAKRIEGEKSE